MSNALFPLPNRILWDSAIEVEHRVDIQRNAGGHEQRVARWATPLYAYPLSLGEMTDAEFQTLIDFINARQGPLDNFLIDDPISGTQRRVRFGDNVTTLVWRFYQGTYIDDLVIQEVRDAGP